MPMIPEVQSIELEVQRGLTAWFIGSNPTPVTLLARIREKQSNGGWKWIEQSPRPEQTVRLIDPGPTPVVVTLVGIEREIVYLLVAAWDAVVGVGDKFTVDGDDLEVVQMLHFNGYEVRAQVARQMRPPTVVGP